MIFESIITTVDREDQVNIAPMGVIVDDQFSWSHATGQPFQLRPFEPSQTLNNLRLNRSGVWQFVDDVLLIAKSALNQLAEDELGLSATQKIVGKFINESTAVFEFAVRSFDQHGNRWFVNCEVVNSRCMRPFPGYNRAQFAVLEGTILATRLNWIPREVIESQLESLAPLVSKTGGKREVEAWDWLLAWLKQQWQESSDD